MENLYKTTRKNLEKGMVLVIVMLFLLVISFLAINLLNSSLLETKMSNYYQNRVQAFYEAETNLEQYEQEIITGKITSNAIKEITNTDICGVTFYHITASAKHNIASSILQSTFAKVDNTINCNPKSNIKTGQQSFLIIH